MNNQKYNNHTLPLPKITPSSVLDLACPKKFWTLRVLDQWPKREPNSWGAFGQVLHTTLKLVYNPQNPNRPDIANLDLYVRKALDRHRYADKRAEAADAARVKRMVRGYVAAEDDEDHNDARGTIAVECLLRHEITYEDKLLFMLSARLDRLIVRPDEPQVLVVRDYKSGGTPAALETSFMQLWAAKLTYGSKYTAYRLEIDYIDSDGRIDRDIVEANHLKGVHGWIMERAASVLMATDHPAEPSEEACTWCPLAQNCPAVQGRFARLEDDVFVDDYN